MEKYDIFIQAGQSNADGWGQGSVAQEYVPDSRVLYLTGSDPLLPEYDPNAPYEITVAQERCCLINGKMEKVGDLALTFAKEYIERDCLEPDRKLLIVRSAVGGTGFLNNHWEMDAPLYKRMLDMTDYVLSLNPENRLMGLLWHQGEHEVVGGNPPQRYHAQLLALLDSVRNRYQCPQLPFICGGFCDEWARKTPVGCEAITRVIRDVAAEREGIFVETGDLLSNNQKFGNGDDIHFCRESLQILGHRYFEAYCQLTHL